MKTLLLAALAVTASGQFAFRAVDAKSLELTENGAPVFVYNHGTMLAPGAPADRARCCYLHPVYAPNGVVITDDFPKDHFHHRGISWMWPVVIVDGQKYDLWTIKGILARSEKMENRAVGRDHAELSLRNGWYIGERKVVEENVQIIVHPTVDGRRDIDFSMTFKPVGADVQIAGSPDENKGYGGFNIRFPPREGTRIDTASGRDVKDSDLVPNAWAELTATYGGKPASARITVDPKSAGFPNGWCLRHYGFLGANFPGLKPYKLEAAAPLAMKFTVTLGDGSPQKKVALVYTKNGKGYVHDNIADSVAAIRKLGAENGFSVDATDDPGAFTTANLKKYKAIVFSNTNNEAFDTEAQRDAFQRYIQTGGGFVGIHSATGSERAWPWYWQMIGGSFLRHPKLQKIAVSVVDPNHPATRGLPASFDWEDECYMHQYMNPDIHALLETDETKLDDPGRKQHPAELMAKHLPLAWTLQDEGSGRRFYVALGHKKEYYSNPTMLKLILGGIQWAMGD